MLVLPGVLLPCSHLYQHDKNDIVKMFLSCPTQLDESVIGGIAAGESEARNKSMIKKWCQTYTNAVSELYQSCYKLLTGCSF